MFVVIAVVLSVVVVSLDLKNLIYAPARFFVLHLVSLFNFTARLDTSHTPRSTRLPWAPFAIGFLLEALETASAATAELGGRQFHEAVDTQVVNNWLGMDMLGVL